MKEKTIEILDTLDNTDVIKRLKELSLMINNNNEYNNIMKDFIENKSNYNNGTEEILNLRKKLFDIEELKEYLELQNQLRFLSIKINNIIMSVLN